MTARSIPNLRRDLPISVALLTMAIVAVVPGAIAVIIALSGITGLMLLRLTMGHLGVPRRNASVPSGNAGPERTSN